MPRHLVSIADLDAAEIVRDPRSRRPLLAAARDEPIKKLTSLRGRTVINLFFESSTRTRTSFEIAAKRLSAEAINISGVGVVDHQGRDAARHRAQPRWRCTPTRSSCATRSAAPRRCSRSSVRVRGDQRRRRPARAPDAGAARRRDDPPPQGHDRRARGRDRRRHRALARRALEHPVPREARRADPAVRAVDADPARHRARSAAS